MMVITMLFSQWGLLIKQQFTKEKERTEKWKVIYNSERAEAGNGVSNPKLGSERVIQSFVTKNKLFFNVERVHNTISRV